MNNLTLLRIASRVTLQILVYGTLGALLLGIMAARIIELAMLLLGRKAFGFSWLGILFGAVFMIVIGLTAGRRRNQWEAFQMIFGGCVIGVIGAGFLGSLTALIIWGFWGDVLGELMLWLQILFGAIVGTLYFTLHPKYAPREEPVIVFSDDYLKDEKIEWK